jgi:hypothetical protein
MNSLAWVEIVEAIIEEGDPIDGWHNPCCIGTFCPFFQVWIQHEP